MRILEIYDQQDMLLSQVSLRVFQMAAPKKSKHIQILLQAENLFTNLFFFSSAINQCLGSLQSAARFGVTLSGDVAGKAAGPASRERNGLCWRAAKICIQKAITWVAL